MIFLFTVNIYITYDIYDNYEKGGAVEALKRPLGMTRMKEEKRGVPVEEVSVSVVPVEAVDLSHFKKKQQRRCWSPELHKLFLDALLHLGGPNGAYLFINYQYIYIS